MSEKTIGATTNVAYKVDASLAEALNRDLAALLFARSCGKCQSRLRKSKTQPGVAKLFRHLARCCATESGFIHHNMPMKEIVFRLLLKNANRPISLSDLHWGVTEDWAHPTHPMNVSVDVMRRVLDADRHYCIVATQAAPKRTRARSRSR